MQTILITGCSSGFGLETAKLFLNRDWNVIATMRSPQADLVPASENLTLLPLDVTDAASIARCLAAAGPIDAVVNNAGIGWLGALEGMDLDIARAIFETNTFGTMAMTQAVLPQFRERRAGVVVNVTSSVTLLPLPLLSVYTASKAAVNAFTTSLAHELAPFNIRARLVLPGRSPGTRFGDNARALGAGAFPDAYAPLAHSVFAAWAQDDVVTLVQDVAETVWTAVTDPASPVILPAGADAVALAA